MGTVAVNMWLWRFLFLVINCHIVLGEVWWYHDDHKFSDGSTKYFHLGDIRAHDYWSNRNYCDDRGAALWCPASHDELKMVFLNLGNMDGFHENRMYMGMSRTSAWEAANEALGVWPLPDTPEKDGWKCGMDSDGYNGQWTWENEGHLEWSPKEPNNHNGNEACSAIGEFFSWQMNDINCDWAHAAYQPVCVTKHEPWGADVWELDDDLHHLEKKLEEKRSGAIGAILFFFLIIFCCCAGAKKKEAPAAAAAAAAPPPPAQVAMPMQQMRPITPVVPMAAPVMAPMMAPAPVMAPAPMMPAYGAPPSPYGAPPSPYGYGAPPPPQPQQQAFNITIANNNNNTN